VQFLAHADGGRHGPGAVGVDAERHVGEFSPECLDGRNFFFGREDAGLQFQGAETVVVRHGPGLLNDPFGIQCGAPAVLGLARVACPFVEQVAAELHRFPDGTAEEVADGPAQEFSLDVQGCDVERGQHAVRGARARDHAAHAVSALDGVLLQRPGDLAAQRVDVEHVRAGQGRCRQLKACEMAGIAVGLAKAGNADVRLDFDDRPQGERLMNAHGVEEGGSLKATGVMEMPVILAWLRCWAGSYAWFTALCSLDSLSPWGLIKPALFTTIRGVINSSPS
jgi:hypothetical protein